MSWQEVTPINAKTAKGLVAYRYSPKFGASIAVPAAVAAALHWKSGTTLKLFVGGGEHAGKLRLASVSAGLIAVRASKGGTLIVHLGKLPQLPEREVKRTTVSHETDAGSLTITLPTYALAMAPAPLVPARPSLPAGKVDVIEKVVGANPKPRSYAPQSGTRSQ